MVSEVHGICDQVRLHTGPPTSITPNRATYPPSAAAHAAKASAPKLDRRTRRRLFGPRASVLNPGLGPEEISLPHSLPGRKIRIDAVKAYGVVPECQVLRREALLRHHCIKNDVLQFHFAARATRVWPLALGRIHPGDLSARWKQGYTPTCQGGSPFCLRRSPRPYG